MNFRAKVLIIYEIAKKKNKKLTNSPSPVLRTPSPLRAREKLVRTLKWNYHNEL